MVKDEEQRYGLLFKMLSFCCGYSIPKCNHALSNNIDFNKQTNNKMEFTFMKILLFSLYH